MNGQRMKAVMIFSLLYATIYPYPQISLYLEKAFAGIPLKLEIIVPGFILLNLAGLLIGGLFIRNIRDARRIMFSGALAILASHAAIIFLGGVAAQASSLAAAILLGSLLSAFGFYFRACSTRDERMAMAGGMVIGYNIVYLILNVLTTLLSLEARLAAMMLFISAAMILIWQSQGIADEEAVQQLQEPRQQGTSNRALLLLFIFIVAVMVTAGMLNELVLPAYYADYPYEAMLYNIPYIVSAFLLLQAARRVSLHHILNFSLALLGFSLVAVVVNHPSHLGLFLANIFLQGGIGIISIFILSMIGELLSLYRKPALVFGLGFAANRLAAVAVTAVFVGEARTISKMDLALAGFVAVLLAIILLPELYRTLSRTIENHTILRIFLLKPDEEQVRTVVELTGSKGLTNRENEIVALLLKGYTYGMIAEELRVTHSTVKTHISNVYTKMEVRSKSDLIQKLAHGSGSNPVL